VRQVPDRLKRFDPVAAGRDDVKVVFGTENADQAAQKKGHPPAVTLLTQAMTHRNKSEWNEMLSL